MSTIAAIATARGQGGIAIVRVSGENARQILEQAFRPARADACLTPGMMRYGYITDRDGGILDEAMAVFFAAPRSYTREDVAELQCHGGDAAASRTLARVLELGAMPAGPGEFTKRAFLNGRIDLSRAEAVMQIIGANGEAAARAGVRQLEGGVTGFVREIQSRVLSQLAAIEACTDYPDEVEEEAAAEAVAEALNGIIEDLDRRCDPRNARILRSGASIVLAGSPNVGKSSLMNALLSQERAIVTAIPGTTRDVLTERITLGGVTAELSDTAGQRDTDNVVERMGVERARSAVESADIVLMVLDGSRALTDEEKEMLAGRDGRTIVIVNKCDALCSERFPEEAMLLSAKTGEGVEALTGCLEARIKRDLSEDSLTVERQIACAKRASDQLNGALSAIRAGMPLDMAAIDLREAMSSLSEITLENPTEAVIDEIFAKFCVGK